MLAESLRLMRSVGRRRACGPVGGDLLVVVAVDVAVATRPDEVTHVQIALLRHHVREQRIAGDVERHTQRCRHCVVELAAQRAAPPGSCAGAT